MSLILEIATILGGIAAVLSILQLLSASRARRIRDAKKEDQETEHAKPQAHPRKMLPTVQGFQRARPMTPLPMQESVQPLRPQERLASKDVTAYRSSAGIRWLSDIWLTLPDTIIEVLGDNIVSGLLFALAPVLLIFFSEVWVGFQVGLYVMGQPLEPLFSHTDYRSVNDFAVVVAFASAFAFGGLFSKFGKLFDDDSTNASKALFTYLGLFAGIYAAKEAGTSYYLVPAIGCIVGPYTAFFLNMLNDRYRKKSGLPERNR